MSKAFPSASMFSPTCARAFPGPISFQLPLRQHSRWGGQAGCSPSAPLPQFASVAQWEGSVKGMGLDFRREGTHPPVTWPWDKVA